MLSQSSPAVPPRILHVAETARGGVGTYLAELLPKQIDRYGAGPLRVLVPARDAGQLAGVDRQLLHLWRRERRSLGDMATLAHAIAREVSAFAPDVIHAHSTFAGLIVRLLYGTRGDRPAILYCPHGWAFDRISSGASVAAARRVERALARWCDRIVVISDHELRLGEAAGIDPARMTVVMNGIADTRSPPPSHWQDQRLKVLFVGRLDRQKGFDTLLDAAGPLAGRIAVRAIGAAVVGAGKGAARRQGNVERLGWRSLSEIGAEIAAADVVVIPSRWEGFGLVAVEAMRGGRAVIASNVGGLREIVVDGITGRLIGPDSPVDLIQALSGGTRENWHAMGRAGRKRFLERFTADRMAAELDDLYASLTGSRADHVACELQPRLPAQKVAQRA